MKRGTKASLMNDQATGVILIAKEHGKLHAKRSTRLDRTWAVRDAEQTQRQRKREKWQREMRPILTHTVISRTRNNYQWDWK